MTVNTSTLTERLNALKALRPLEEFMSPEGAARVLQTLGGVESLRTVNWAITSGELPAVRRHPQVRKVKRPGAAVIEPTVEIAVTEVLKVWARRYLRLIENGDQSVPLEFPGYGNHLDFEKDEVEAWVSRFQAEQPWDEWRVHGFDDIGVSVKPTKVAEAEVARRERTAQAHDRRKRRYDAVVRLCQETMQKVPTAERPNFPRGVGRLAAEEKISRQAFTEDIEQYLNFPDGR